MQFLGNSAKTKKKRSWLTGALGGTLLAALVLPLALTNVSAALDNGGFLIQATNNEDPSITSISGMKLSNSNGGGNEEPEEPSVPEMISTWKISSGQNLILPLGGAVNVTVNWGDGTPVEAVYTSNPSHNFADTNPEQVITIEGTFDSWGRWDWGAGSKSLLSVDEWGSTGTTNLDYAFIDADNLRHVESIPATTSTFAYSFMNVDSEFTLGDLDTSNVTNMDYMFQNTTKFNYPVSFDAKNVKTMSKMFSGATSFNQPVTLKNSSNVTTTENMFFGAKVFNKPIILDTANVTTMYYMFSGATAFNQPISFDTKNVTTMYAMFFGATAFDSPISFTDTSNVTTMGWMFRSASSFNQPINFNTESVESMSAMFSLAPAFNQPINFSNTSNVMSMSAMFLGATRFDQPVTFNTESVTDMSGMFSSASAFNQPISFDTKNVTKLEDFLKDAITFNKPISFTDISKIKSIIYMFNGAKAFNQDLSSWKFQPLTSSLKYATNATSWQAAFKPKFS